MERALTATYSTEHLETIGGGGGVGGGGYYNIWVFAEEGTEKTTIIQIQPLLTITIESKS